MLCEVLIHESSFTRREPVFDVWRALGDACDSLKVGVTLQVAAVVPAEVAQLAHSGVRQEFDHSAFPRAVVQACNERSKAPFHRC